jgi:hypothetical protein
MVPSAMSPSAPEAAPAGGLTTAMFGDDPGGDLYCSNGCENEVVVLIDG